MSERIEVYSQAEFDACIKAGNVAIVIGCSVVARENSSVVARENSRVVAWENSSVVAWGNSSVVARGGSSVVARENVFIRFFFAFKITASDNVVILNHKTGDISKVYGGRVLDIVE